MTTFLYSHPACVLHDPGGMHPECPGRLKAVLDGLDDEAFKYLKRHEAPEIDLRIVELVHTPYYIENIVALSPEKGRVQIDADTSMSSRSLEAARRSSGAAVEAVDQVITGFAKNAFCAVRPPGHHAESSRAMGFCLFNGAAIAAFHARSAHSLDKVAVIDFDVHHGNGTQHSFEQEPNLFYASSHQSPAYPGTGKETDEGCANNICNVTLPPGSGSLEFKSGYTKRILPALESFNPELIIISAGFDAHSKDPLAQINLEASDYGWISQKILELAEKCCGGRVISILEGGYDIEALRESVQVHVRALIDA